MQYPPLSKTQIVEAKAEIANAQEDVLSKMREYDSYRVFKSARLMLISWIGLFSAVLLVIAFFGGREILTEVAKVLAGEALEEELEVQLSDVRQRLDEFDRVREAEGFLTEGGVEAYLEKTLYNLDMSLWLCGQNEDAIPFVWNIQLMFDEPFMSNGNEYQAISLQKRGLAEGWGFETEVWERNGLPCVQTRAIWDVSRRSTPYFRRADSLPLVSAISFASIRLTESSGDPNPEADEAKFRADWDAIDAFEMWLGVNGRATLVMFRPGKILEDENLSRESTLRLTSDLKFVKRQDRVGRVYLDAVYAFDKPFKLDEVLVEP